METFYTLAGYGALSFGLLAGCGVLLWGLSKIVEAEQRQHS